MIKAYLIRREYTDKQILGHFILFDETDVIFECKTLELPWKNNENNVSCIPAGEYILRKRYSPKNKKHFHVLEEDGSEVTGRNLILIHHGNYNTDILGCILVGQSHVDINKDGYRDVTSSRKTMRLLNQAITVEPLPFQIIGQF